MNFKPTLTGLRARFDDGLAHLHCAVYRANCPLTRQALHKLPPGQLLYALYISHRYRYVYVDNPKTGCSSLKSALVELEARNGQPEVDCYDWKVLHNRDRSILLQLTDLHSVRPLTDLVGQGYRFISFVRNPYTRLLSGYRDKIRKPHYRRELLALMGMPVDAEYTPSFDDFVRVVSAQTDYAMNPHWRPQTSQILYGLIGYAFVGRFEDYDNEFVRLFRLLGLNDDAVPVCRNLNWNQDQAVSLDTFYTPELKQRVYQRYQADFELLGYDR